MLTLCKTSRHLFCINLNLLKVIYLKNGKRLIKFQQISTQHFTKQLLDEECSFLEGCHTTF